MMMHRSLLFLVVVTLLATAVDAQGHHKKKHKKSKTGSKGGIKKSEHNVKEQLKESEKAIDEEAKAKANAARANAASMIAQAETKAAHIQTQGDHLKEKAEGELDDVQKAARREGKDQKKADKDYKSDVKYWEHQEKDAKDRVAQQIKRSDKLTEHLPKEERAQYKHYARQQAQHSEASIVARVEATATQEEKEAMWKQAGRIVKDQREFSNYEDKETHEAKSLDKKAKKDSGKAKKDAKAATKMAEADFKDKVKEIKTEEKTEKNAVKHKYFKNLNRTQYTPAPTEAGGFGMIEEQQTTSQLSSLGMVGFAALGSFMAALAVILGLERSGRRVVIVSNSRLPTVQVDAEDPEVGPAMYEPLAGQ